MKIIFLPDGPDGEKRINYSCLPGDHLNLEFYREAIVKVEVFNYPFEIPVKEHPHEEPL